MNIYRMPGDPPGTWRPYRQPVPVPESRASITCPICGMTSYNPNDIREGYCGNCHDWTSPGGDHG